MATDRVPPDERGISPRSRFTKRNPCPVCGGGDNDPRGRGERCSGFLSGDGEYAHCTREEFAGQIAPSNASPPTYAHRMHGPCRCGVTHNPAAIRAAEVRAPDVYHIYRDAQGKVLYRVVRQQLGAKKKIFQQRQDASGEWVSGRGKAPRVLYRLDEIAKADPTQPVYVVEGEKCADALVKRGLMATTSVEGAEKWHLTPGAAEALRGRHVVVLPDNDEPGHRHGEQVVRSLSGVAASVRVVTLPDLPEKGDVVDWLAAGFTVTDLVNLVTGAPVLEPEPIRVPGVLLSEVEQRAVNWLWKQRIARGKLTIIDGDPGLGKGMMTNDLAARISRGRAFPGDLPNLKRGPGNVLLLTPEDDPEDTIKPRLAAADADMTRIRVLSTVSEEDIETGKTRDRLITIPRDIAILEATIAHDKPELLIVDPITACLDAGIKTSNDNEVRAALMPLKMLAERTGVAIVLVRHLNKSGGDNALYRGGGSIAFTGLCRTAFLVGVHPDNGEKRVLAAVKSNIGRLAPTLAFALVSLDPDAVPYVVWDQEECEYDARAILGSRMSDLRRDIVQTIKANKGPMTTADICTALGADDENAKARIRVALGRMVKAGQITQPTRGHYDLNSSSLSSSVTSVTSVTFDTSVTSDTSLEGDGGNGRANVTLLQGGVTNVLHSPSPDRMRAEDPNVTLVSVVTGPEGSRVYGRPCMKCGNPLVVRADGGYEPCEMCAKNAK